MSFVEILKKKQWSSQEIDLLKQYYPQFSSKKWKKISQIFKQNGYDRSQLEIRQRWINYEDPDLLFTQWTDQELEILYKSYTKFGSKWCFIKKSIAGRTENKIKNKFYGNVRIFLRFVVNYFNKSKQDTMWIHKINPKILNDLYQGVQSKKVYIIGFKDYGNIVQAAIRQMGYKVDKIQLLALIQKNIQVYRRFYEKIIELYKGMDLNFSINSRRRRLNFSMKPQHSMNQISEEEQINSQHQNNIQKQSVRENISTKNNQKVDLNSQPSNLQINPIFPFSFLNQGSNMINNFPFINAQNIYPFFNYWGFNS